MITQVSLSNSFRNKKILTSLVATLVFTGNAMAATDLSSYGSAEFVANEVLVKYQPTIAENMQPAVLTGMNVLSSKAVGTSGYHLVKLSGLTTAQAISTLTGREGVAAVQPNFIYHANLAPADSQYGQLWGLKNVSQSVSSGSYSTNNPGIAGNDMDAELAWNHITDCANTTVAVLDTGVQYKHEDLAANMWNGAGAGFPNHGYDFIDNDPDPMDTHGHGTHVAGTIGAQGNNNKGTTGVCWQASIMAVRVLGTSGSGSTAGIVQGVNFATANGAKVINMSLGGSNFDTAFDTAIANAGAAGVAVIVAAGNAGSDNDVSPAYPCNYDQPSLLCVAALDQAYELASFSNYGATTVDVGAPGTNIRSSWNSTPVVSLDNFGAWTKTGAWTAVPATNSCIWNGDTSDPVFYDILVNPSNWCSSGFYAQSANDVAYRQYTLPGTQDFVVATHYMSWDIAAGDNVSINYSISGNPFTAGTNLVFGSGTSAGNISSFGHELTGCAGTLTCSFGIRLSGNGDAAVGEGLMATYFKLNIGSTIAYNTINGTSMATPHVAGLAAMLFAFNPDYTYADVLQAIKSGGEAVAALAGLTTSGNAVNAMGALAHIQAPTNVTAAIP